MKRQFPGNSNNQRGDPRFLGGRGRGRGQMNSPGPSGPGRGGPYRGGGPPHMNGARGGGPMGNFSPSGRGPPHKSFGRGPGKPGMMQQQHPYHNNHMQPPPPSQYQNYNNNRPPGPPPMRGGPPSGMMGRGRTNMGHNSFNGGRGRGRNNMPERNLFGGRGGPQQRRPPPPFRGRGNGPPPGPHHPHSGVHAGPNGTSQNFNDQMDPQRPPYRSTPGLGTQQQQPHNGFQRQQQYQLPLQQPGPPNAASVTHAQLPYQQLQAHHQQRPPSVNNNGFASFQQGTSGNQLQFQKAIVPPSSNPSATQVEEAWKAYTAPGGVKYYYNELSKESTYEKPDALKKMEQNYNTGSTTDASSSSSKQRVWQEHEDAATGKKYYSNGVQTTWEKPAGFISPETIVANTSSGSKRQENNEHEGPTTKKKKKRSSYSPDGDSNTNGQNFTSKKEAIGGFKRLLLAKGVSPSYKWNEVLKVCESDSSWDSFEVILSMGERRQALAEYQTKRSNELRNEQRQVRIRAKESFTQMLTDVLPSISGFSARSSRFTDVRNALSKDDRFLAIEDEATRESLFFDFCDDFKKREERSKRNKQREIQKSFASFLQEREENGTLSHISTWESFLSTLSEEEKGDSRFTTSVDLLDSERKLYFADFVDDLQKAEDDKRRKIQDERRRAEKAQRDKYREVLHQLAVAGKIFPYSRWREVEDLLLADDSFKPVEDQDRGAPRELFEIFVEDWDGIYRRERSFLLRLLHPSGKPDVLIPAGTTYDDFKKTITEEAAHSSDMENETLRIIEREDPVSSARLLHDELASQPSDIKRGTRRGSANDDSSEDEGEIIEDGEIADDDGEGDNGNNAE